MKRMSNNQQLYLTIGASAGGLEALKTLFSSLKKGLGFSFFLMQHHLPTKNSQLNEVLSNYTNMKVVVATDGMTPEEDCLYVIPPGHKMTIFHEKIYLHPEKTTNKPIDEFLNELSKDMKERAIALILSGTGTDGTKGAQAIKEHGGTVLVQQLNSAQYTSMPEHVIKSGYYDSIIDLKNIMKHLNDIREGFENREDFTLSDNEHIDKVIRAGMIIRNYKELDFTQYKNAIILRRIDRRMEVTEIKDYDAYLEYLDESNKEKDALIQELLIGVTAFFRDWSAFKALMDTVLPKINYDKDMIRVWSAACSTGEEAYSLAILFMEYFEKNNIDMPLKVFATDIDKSALEVATHGFYSFKALGDMPKCYLEKYFSETENGYRVKEHLRKKVVFARHNLLKDPPFSNLDILSCRNLFIYLRNEVQNEVLQRFYFSLGHSGYLFLGHSETVNQLSEAFDEIDSKWKIYKFKSDYTKIIDKLLPYKGRQARKENFLQKSTNDDVLEAIVNQYMPSGVVVDRQYNIIRVIGDVSNYISPQSGRFSDNLLDLLETDMKLHIQEAVALLKHMSQQKVELTVQRASEQIHLSAMTLKVSGDSNFMILFDTFHDQEIKEETTENTKQYRNIEVELKRAKNEMREVIEDLEIANLKLNERNEELMLTNEELQSTNEELQSVNEELFTLNNELENNIKELKNLNNDLNNLIRNTGVGAMYLDEELKIRKITPLISKLTNIMDIDIGRPITDLSVMSAYEDFNDDLHQVLETLNSVEKEVDINGTTYLGRMQPYRDENHAVDGIIFTMVDISQLKEAKRALEDGNLRLQNVLDIGNIAWWEYNLSTGYVAYSDKKATMAGYTVEEFPNEVYAICDLIHPDDYETTMEAMRQYVMGNSEEWNITYRIKRKEGGYSYYHDVGHIVEWTEEGQPLKLIGAVIDISKVKLLENELQNLLKQGAH